jgi:hypothetical protein
MSIDEELAKRDLSFLMVGRAGGDIRIDQLLSHRAHQSAELPDR